MGSRVKFDEAAALQWLKLWDKTLFGMNSPMNKAVKKSGIAGFTVRKLNIMLFDFTTRTSKKGKTVKTKEWCETLEWWKCPDKEEGPRKPTKATSLTRAKWDSIKTFIERHRELFEKPDSTIPFVVRYMRKNWMPANEHIVRELFTLRKIPIREEPVKAEATP